MKTSIVAAVDFSSTTPLVLEQAAKEAKLRPGAQLHLVHVIAPPIAPPVGAIAPNIGLDMTGAIDAAREELQRVARGTNLAGLEVTGHVRVGGSVDEIIALADELDATLIVVGASVKGLAMRALLGSTARPLIDERNYGSFTRSFTLPSAFACVTTVTTSTRWAGPVRGSTPRFAPFSRSGPPRTQPRTTSAT